MTMRDITADDIESLAIGAWVLGTGGGGVHYQAGDYCQQAFPRSTAVTKLTLNFTMSDLTSGCAVGATHGVRGEAERHERGDLLVRDPDRRYGHREQELHVRVDRSVGRQLHDPPRGDHHGLWGRLVVELEPGRDGDAAVR